MPRVTNPRTRLKEAINQINNMFGRELTVSYVDYIFHNQNETKVTLYKNEQFPIRFQYQLEFHNNILVLLKGDLKWKVTNKKDMENFKQKIIEEILIDKKDFLKRLNDGAYGNQARIGHKGYQYFESFKEDYYSGKPDATKRFNPKLVEEVLV